jgi:hypothetical protein
VSWIASIAEFVLCASEQENMWVVTIGFKDFATGTFSTNEQRG